MPRIVMITAEHRDLMPRIPRIPRAKLALLLIKGEALRPEAPGTWVAPNGLLVQGNVSGWNHSFHESDYWPSLIWLVAPHRHLGPQARALRAYALAWVIPEITARFYLRRMVRPGD